MERWLVVAAVALAGCGRELCVTSFDCVEGLLCMEGACVGPTAPPPHVDRTDGWDAPPGAGRGYLVTDGQLLSAGSGFDLDGWCPGDRCADNRLAGIADQLSLNPIDVRNLIEIAGVDQPFEGDDVRVTVKTYEGVAESALTSRFTVTPRSLTSSPAQARWRLPARYQDYRATHAGRGTAALFLAEPNVGEPARLFELRRAAVEVSTVFGDRLSILIGGAVPARQLITPGLSLLDLLASRGVQPDIDLDGDGLESFEFDPMTGRISACYDGCLEGCPTPLPVDPVYLDSPWTCANRDQIADGYSAAFTLTAQPTLIINP